MWQSLFTDMFNSLKPSCSTLGEAVVLSIHLFNVSKGFECTGLLEDDPTTSDLLPEKWNKNPQLFSFRYIYKSKTVYQKHLKMTQSRLSLHSVRSDKNDKVYQFNVDLNEIEGSWSEPEFNEKVTSKVLLKYEEQVVQKMFESESVKKNTSEEGKNAKRSVLEDDMPYGVPFGVPFSGGFGIPSNPYSGPFGGGNLVGPNHPMFSRPPGSRWEPPDPFNMPPDPDHFFPPGPQGPFQPFGRGRFGGPPGYF